MPTAPNPGVNYGPNANKLPAWAEGMLLAYVRAAGMDRLLINSTTRTVEQQISAMYDNEKNGNHIQYAAGGMKVIALINQMGFAVPKSDVVAAGAKLMRELVSKKQMASYHVGEFCPAGFAAVDISPSSVQSKYSTLMDVLDAAKVRGELKELIVPPKDPAVHVVLVQSKSDQVVAALDHAASGGHSASYEGDDEHPGVVAAGGGLLLLLGGAGLLWWLTYRRKG